MDYRKKVYLTSRLEDLDQKVVFMGLPLWETYKRKICPTTQEKLLIVVWGPGMLIDPPYVYIARTAAQCLVRKVLLFVFVGAKSPSVHG